MLPDNGGRLGGYAGAAVWRSSPAIDINRRLVYVATGNLYTAPAEVLKCQQEQNNQTVKPSHPDQCIGPDINYNSIIALDMTSILEGSDAPGNLGAMTFFISLV